MSFNDLILLLLFVLFVVLPSINRNQQRQRGAPPQRPAGQRPAAAGRGAQSTRRSPLEEAMEGQGRAATPGGPGGQAAPTALDVELSDGDDELARRIAEARRRVQEATGGTSGPGMAGADPRAQAARPLVSAPPSSVGGGGANVDPRVRARAPLAGGATGATVLRPSAAPRAAQSSATTSRPPAQRALRLSESAAPIEVQRLSARASAGPKAMALSPQQLREALVWREILGPPRARRRLGGGPSQLQ